MPANVGDDSGERVLELRLIRLAPLDQDHQLLDLLVFTEELLRVVFAAQSDERRVEGPLLGVGVQ